MGIFSKIKAVFVPEPDLSGGMSTLDGGMSMADGTIQSSYIPPKIEPPRQTYYKPVPQNQNVQKANAVLSKYREDSITTDATRAIKRMGVDLLDSGKETVRYAKEKGVIDAASTTVGIAAVSAADTAYKYAKGATKIGVNSLDYLQDNYLDDSSVGGYINDLLLFPDADELRSDLSKTEDRLYNASVDLKIQEFMDIMGRKNELGGEGSIGNFIGSGAVEGAMLSAIGVERLVGKGAGRLFLRNPKLGGFTSGVVNEGLEEVVSGNLQNYADNSQFLTSRDSMVALLAGGMASGAIRGSTVALSEIVGKNNIVPIGKSGDNVVKRNTQEIDRLKKEASSIGNTTINNNFDTSKIDEIVKNRFGGSYDIEAVENGIALRGGNTSLVINNDGTYYSRPSQEIQSIIGDNYEVKRDRGNSLLIENKQNNSKVFIKDTGETFVNGNPIKTEDNIYNYIRYSEGKIDTDTPKELVEAFRGKSNADTLSSINEKIEFLDGDNQDVISSIIASGETTFVSGNQDLVDSINESIIDGEKEFESLVKRTMPRSNASRIGTLTKFYEGSSEMLMRFNDDQKIRQDVIRLRERFELGKATDIRRHEALGINQARKDIIASHGIENNLIKKLFTLISRPIVNLFKGVPSGDIIINQAEINEIEVRQKDALKAYQEGVVAINNGDFNQNNPFHIAAATNEIAKSDSYGNYVSKVQYDTILQRITEYFSSSDNVEYFRKIRNIAASSKSSLDIYNNSDSKAGMIKPKSVLETVMDEIYKDISSTDDSKILSNISGIGFINSFAKDYYSKLKKDIISEPNSYLKYNQLIAKQTEMSGYKDVYIKNENGLIVVPFGAEQNFRPNELDNQSMSLAITEYIEGDSYFWGTEDANAEGEQISPSMELLHVKDFLINNMLLFLDTSKMDIETKKKTLGIIHKRNPLVYKYIISGVVDKQDIVDMNTKLDKLGLILAEEDILTADIVKSSAEEFNSFSLSEIDISIDIQKQFKRYSRDIDEVKIQSSKKALEEYRNNLDYENKKILKLEEDISLEQDPEIKKSLEINAISSKKSLSDVRNNIEKAERDVRLYSKNGIYNILRRSNDIYSSGKKDSQLRVDHSISKSRRKNGDGIENAFIPYDITTVVNTMSKEMSINSQLNIVKHYGNPNSKIKTEYIPDSVRNYITNNYKRNPDMEQILSAYEAHILDVESSFYREDVIRDAASSIRTLLAITYDPLNMISNEIVAPAGRVATGAVLDPKLFVSALTDVIKSISSEAGSYYNQMHDADIPTFESIYGYKNRRNMLHKILASDNTGMNAMLFYESYIREYGEADYKSQKKYAKLNGFMHRISALNRANYTIGNGNVFSTYDFNTTLQTQAGTEGVDTFTGFGGVGSNIDGRVSNVKNFSQTASKITAVSLLAKKVLISPWTFVLGYLASSIQRIDLQIHNNAIIKHFADRDIDSIRRIAENDTLEFRDLDDVVYDADGNIYNIDEIITNSFTKTLDTYNNRYNKAPVAIERLIRSVASETNADLSQKSAIRSGIQISVLMFSNFWNAATNHVRDLKRVTGAKYYQILPVFVLTTAGLFHAVKEIFSKEEEERKTDKISRYSIISNIGADTLAAITGINKDSKTYSEILKVMNSIAQNLPGGITTDSLVAKIGGTYLYRQAVQGDGEEEKAAVKYALEVLKGTLPAYEILKNSPNSAFKDYESFQSVISSIYSDIGSLVMPESFESEVIEPIVITEDGKVDREMLTRSAYSSLRDTPEMLGTDGFRKDLMAKASMVTDKDIKMPTVSNYTFMAIKEDAKNHGYGSEFEYIKDTVERAGKESSFSNIIKEIKKMGLQGGEASKILDQYAKSEGFKDYPDFIKTMGKKNRIALALYENNMISSEGFKEITGAETSVISMAIKRKRKRYSEMNKIKAGDSTANRSALVERAISKYPEGSNIGKNCVLFARKIVPSLPKGLFTLEDKINIMARDKVNGLSRQDIISAPRVGDVIIEDTGIPSGHVAVINEVDIVRGTIKLTESNMDGKNTIKHTRTIPINSPKILGGWRQRPASDL